MHLSNQINNKVETLDEKLNAKIGRNANHLKSYLNEMVIFGRTEVGWRESCGSTDQTMLVFREWKKVLKLLKSQGIEILEERLNHGNSYATSKGGFWNSIIYKII